VRLGFSYHDETELLEAVRRMARALTRTRTSQLAAQVNSPGKQMTHAERVRNDLVHQKSGHG
jgi:hypothetical protein